MNNQQLIRDCQEEIEVLENHINRLKKYDDTFDTSIYESRLQRQKIALASLTAEPEMWEINNPGEGSYFMPEKPREGDYRRDLIRREWFTAPPTPIDLDTVLDSFNSHGYEIDGAGVTPENLAQAVNVVFGQLSDYAAQIDAQPDLAALVPERVTSGAILDALMTHYEVDHYSNALEMFEQSDDQFEDIAAAVRLIVAPPMPVDLAARVPDEIPSGVYNVIYQECGGFVDSNANAQNIWDACRAEMLRRIAATAPQQEASNG